MENVEVLDLPKQFFKKKCSFTMDFGGSAIKIIYTTEEGENIRLHFVTYSREDIEEAFKMLADKFTDKLEAGSEIFTCGIGASEYNAKLNELFDLKFTNTHEMDRLAEGFCFMAKHLDWTDFVHPISKSAMHFGQVLGEDNLQMMNVPVVIGNGVPWKLEEVVKFQARKKAGEEEPSPDTCVHFPTLLCLVGSAAVYIKVEADGTYTTCDFSSIAGRAFLGLGSILTDGKCYSELCDLASRGDPTTVDMFSDAIPFDTDDEVYSEMLNTAAMKTFAFGHAVGKKRDEFQQEDLVNSLVGLVVEHVVLSAYNWATNLGIKQIFFIGGFPCDNATVQEEFARQCFYRRYNNSTDHTCDCYFLKLGQHCGSIGTILKNLELDAAVLDNNTSNQSTYL